MSASLFQWFIRVVSLSWLTGPIFDKELRVSSRRRRSYVLRFAYVIFFTALTALVWADAVPRHSTSLFQTSRMAQAGQIIVMSVVWFQFIAAQMVALVMLSTAISDEIYNKTLGLLMTTPVGSFQIVLGKLLSKLLQLLLLLAITLPLLAIVRVFGGVPWEFLLCGLSITVTTAIFLGTMSLFFSIFTRRAHTVIIVTILTATVLFLLVPMVSALLLHERCSEVAIIRGISYVNPYFLLAMATENFMVTRSRYVVYWPIHCGIALGSSALLMFLATVFVRKVALRQATGQEIFRPRRRRRGAEQDERSLQRSVRRVVGSCIFWKERRTPLWGRLSVIKIIGTVLTLGLLVLTYGLCAREEALRDDGTQIGYVLAFTMLGLLFTVVLPAASITSEKESRAWPILLTTTVSNWEILWGKLLGAIRRCSVAWLLLFAHVVIFSLVGILHPVAMAHFAVLAAWVVFFLCGTGLYFSTRFRRTTAAVIANVALALSVWAVIPLLWALLFAAVHGDSHLLELYMDLNPTVHAIVICEAAASGDTLGSYDWIQGATKDLASTNIWIAFTAAVYVGVSLLFLWRAWACMRRDPV